MKTPLLQVDHRSAPIETLPQLLTEELSRAPEGALLWCAKRPKKRWFQFIRDWTPLIFSSGPMFEQILWLRQDLATVPPVEFSAERERLLSAYSILFETTGPVEDCHHWLSYRQLLRDHMSLQEQQVYPELLGRLPIERALRELGYEHDGLRTGLSRLEAILEAAREGRLSGRERERFDLDFYHLLEHHLERESEAIYPAIVFFQGVDRKGSSCYNSPHRDDPT